MAHAGETPRRIALERISPDGRLAYRDPAPQWAGAESLGRSLRRCGVLTPLTLREEEHGFSVIAGFRRYALARELGLAELPARIVPSEADAVREAFCQAVEEHAAQEHDPRERARAIRIGLELGLGLKQVSERLLPALGLAAESHLADAHLRLFDLAPPLLDLLMDKRFSLRRCLPFCHLSEEEGRSLAMVARQLALGGKQLEEVATSLQEIARRESLPLLAVMEDLDLLRPASPAPPEVPAAQTAALQAITRRRLPETARRRDELAALAAHLAQLGLEARWDPAFSRDGLELAVRITQLDELRAVLARLEREETRALLQRLLDQL